MLAAQTNVSPDIWVGGGVDVAACVAIARVTR
jgi:hypothetical protein